MAFSRAGVDFNFVVEKDREGASGKGGTLREVTSNFDDNAANLCAEIGDNVIKLRS